MSHPAFAIDDIAQLVATQDDCTTRWHHKPISLPDVDWAQAVLSNHSENFQLWHQEDKARRDDMGFEYVYNAKRAIDGHNQRRNNQMEAMDTLLFAHFHLSQDSNLPLHSETPGMMIDRLSILSLKIHAMRLQTQREDVSADHIAQCEHKLQVLLLQRSHLQHCLAELFADLQAQRKTFRLYKQMKMYNDATLNPELYKNK